MSALPADLDLDACAREPIHLLGAVQPHGFLVALDGDERVAHVSANVGALFGSSAESWIGRPFADVLPQAQATVRAFGPRATSEAMYLRSLTLSLADGPRVFDVAAHRVEDVLVVEFEMRAQEEEGDLAPGLDARLRTFVNDLHVTRGVDDILGLTAREVRAITGFDRVLIYRFDPDWHGAVVAEDRNDALPSYLDLRFPASDIPAQARELYRRNRVRIIPDARYEPAPILPPRSTPLDLSQSTLRSVS
ncbi:MAG TPA: PAS domain-containing protein, partial [Beijerinckiaceae bacterium]